MEEVLRRVCILYNIDFSDQNKEILLTAYEAEKNLNVKFLQSIGIYVDYLEKRIYKRYLKTKRYEYIKFNLC